MAHRRLAEILLLAGIGIGALPACGHAADADPGSADVSVDLDVVSKRLDLARQQIQPSLGASVYTMAPDALAALPQGQDSPLNQVLIQAPGVAEDSYGQVHLRGEHANVQFRLNGVELPEGLSVFGQAIAARFASQLSLITGALPAQYGFQTAGVVDIQTKTGITDPGITASVYGGSWNWGETSLDWGGKSGTWDWFVTADFLHNDRGIENPTDKFAAIHDTTNQFHGLASITDTIDGQTRANLLLGGFDGQFQIPNNPGQPTLGFAVDGISSFASSRLDERQTERTDFAILALQKQYGAADLQTALYVRESALAFSPDWLGDLLFNGIAQRASRSDIAYGIQSDASWRLDDAHTLRAGLLVQQETTGARTLSEVLPVDGSGTPTSDVPLDITGNSLHSGGLFGAYVQDEWRLTPALTLNTGLRFDAVDQFTHENQVSPRINLVWQATPDTTLHAGYARYFVPPPFELVSGGTLAQFLGTTGAPSVTQNDPVRAERSHYFDVGVSQIVLPGLKLGVDGYYKIAQNLIDEGQFGAPIILAAFNYAHGVQQGVEFTASYDRGPLSLYGNVAWSRAMGKHITSAEFNFGADELAFIADNYIHLDHDQTWTGSAGASYTLGADGDHPTRFSLDATVQSGLRATAAGGTPNGIALPTYGVVNFSVVQKLRGGTELRLDVLNIADSVYQIRNGTGVGVGAPQYGIRRSILAGISQHL